MKTINYSKAVQNEINAINEQNQLTTKQVKKRLDIELIGAIITVVAIMGFFFVLNHLGYIKNF
jgi:hypothetical protein